MYFDGIYSLEGLKMQYRTLALANHPDMGGDTAVMQAINVEYDAIHARMAREGMTGAEYRRTVYEEMGWTGENYSINLSMAELTKIIRAYCKGHYPDCKFSVTRRDYNSITVALMEAPFEAIEGEERHIQSYKYKGVTSEARMILQDIEKFGNSYNYDHSDVMRDYFDTGFYLWLHIGKWDKPFKKRDRAVKCSRTKSLRVA